MCFLSGLFMYITSVNCSLLKPTQLCLQNSESESRNMSISMHMSRGLNDSVSNIIFSYVLSSVSAFPNLQI